jgi:post-segregation antitoxin (ccd killing protein)
MGRKRIDLNEKHISVHLSIKKKLLDAAKKEGVNISSILEKALEKYLNR